ncbi:SUN domain-containing protein [Aspergillus chevalieri]|uniref:SUN domain protein n=1 Tax=Aspergillus chevalieri TaxID=182096 RepID=A0A7R7ZMT7_ASPCH|nr:uncharacterized protein ACHE_30539S [Aspergillus chevalieri]BCR86552.1 hypothetical protein ACHE_30539S [Aspergillus chevalieri]
MRFDMTSSRAFALLCLFAGAEATHHNHHAHDHIHSDGRMKESLVKKSGKCKFPSDAGLVAITPGAVNEGWAMSPDESCAPGNYCPYACPPGQMSMQWDPKATSYSYPMSMNGGLYCDEDGEIQKPFPDRPYCEDGTGAVGVQNKCRSPVSFCQTVLPGNEAMLIPTLVNELATLAVPDPDYWCETSAHFYINPPGVQSEIACAWGTSSNPYGNWSPYVVGANTDKDGHTFVKLGWNPVYLEPATPFRNIVPNFGVEIQCEGGNCEGLPCKIDPSTNDVNEITGETSTDGAGGGSFCVVTVPKGEKANIVVWEKDFIGGDDDTSSTTVAIPTSTASSTSSTSTSTSSSTSSTASTTTQQPSNTPFLSLDLGISIGMSTSVRSASATYTYEPHVFIESGTAATVSATPAVQTANPSPTAQDSTEDSDNGAATTTVSLFVVMLGVCAAVLQL